MSGHHPWGAIRRKSQERQEGEARDWAEYLSWTLGATEGQYEETERLAWVRLQSALLQRRIAPVAPTGPPTEDTTTRDRARGLHHVAPDLEGEGDGISFDAEDGRDILFEGE